MNNQTVPLSALLSIDQLIVGPVQIKKDSLKMPYTVKIQSESFINHLIYSYNENVFDSKDPGSANLATMIGSQVAFNYGLFAKEIIFKGSFTETDKQFIAEMIENTACEIYVSKLISPNPYLTEQFSGRIEIKKQTKYTQSNLVFPDQTVSECEKWNLSPDKYCISSSGGKESLLNYGIINEIGKETHPVFINESGKHWFTALNAYRYFESSVTNTTKVWCNSDRIFTWMDGLISCIRKDFKKIRSDAYPIRLWTVAVFIFGLLPLIRKRKLGNLLIGSEFDTTRVVNFQGIKHFDGLFDQSLFFDDRLTKYFFEKKWNIRQFSILRPLGELMVETILAKRYPELLRNQVSCHSAHISNHRVYPCGKCEKCRRIVGILLAIGIEPALCGYTNIQVSRCLNSLKTQSIDQIENDSHQLQYMLYNRGLLNLDEKQIKPSPEVLKLRFDEEHSPNDLIPENIRNSIFQIMYQYESE